MKVDEAWLVTWEWGNKAASKRDKVLYVLRPDASVDQVAFFVQHLYDLFTSTVREMASYAFSGRSPYEVKIDDDQEAVIRCGHNPYIEARKVIDLEVTETDEGYEEISWTALRKDGSTFEDSFKRSKKGSLSFEDAWDRERGTPVEFEEE